MSKRSRRKKRRINFGLGILVLCLVFIRLSIKGAFYISYRYILFEMYGQKYIPLDPEKDHKIQWSDAVLEDQVRQWIDKKEGDIYLSDLWDITGLRMDRWIDDSGIVGDEITDISSLEGLQNLKILSLEYHNVTDIRVISSMVNLEELNLNGNHIKDLSAIEKLRFLDTLDLRNTRIQEEDLGCIAGLKDLDILCLDHNGLEDLEGLADLDLLWLTASGNKIADLSPLERSKRCVHLDLRDNMIIEVEVLSGLKKLEYLNLRNNKITDIAPLCKLRHVSLLNLQDNRITKLPDLSGMTSLYSLNLSGNQITTEEWRKVKLPWSIRKVYITGNPITDLETDREYPGLEVIFEEEMIEDR